MGHLYISILRPITVYQIVLLNNYHITLLNPHINIELHSFEQRLTVLESTSISVFFCCPPFIISLSFTVPNNYHKTLFYTHISIYNYTRLNKTKVQYPRITRQSHELILCQHIKQIYLINFITSIIVLKGMTTLTAMNLSNQHVLVD